VLDTDELLARLEARGVRNVEIARALNLPDSRAPEIKRKKRKLTLDEGATLVRAFELEPEKQTPPLPTPIVRLLLRHVASRMGAALTEEQVADLTEDLRVFAAFVANPKVRESIEAAEGFFEALRLRRPEAALTDQPGTGPGLPN
jgi:hypothetical protein